jgi:hypothetical protein
MVQRMHFVKIGIFKIFGSFDYARFNSFGNPFLSGTIFLL